jgi:altronate hydrolase
MLSADPDRLCRELLEMIAGVAAGKQKTKNELNGCREIAIFKNGVTL